ncbi:MAG: hypothetical protein ACTSO9_01525 [Candidatus Helarchaeota archaeon]
MVHVITQIFSTSIVVGDIGFFLISRNKRTIILAALHAAPIGWVLEIASINLGFFSYSIKQLIPIFGLPLPILFGWFFVILYGSIVLTRLIELVNRENRNLTRNEKVKIYLEVAAIYTFPVSWGPAIISVAYYIYFWLQNNQGVLASHTWHVYDVIGLPLFSYLLWIGVMLYGIFICLLFFEKYKNKSISNFEKFILTITCALTITPLGWGIEFYGVGSHSPIWSYNSSANNPLTILGPYDIPYLIYFGWFCILFIGMYYILSVSYDWWLPKFIPK